MKTLTISLLFILCICCINKTSSAYPLKAFLPYHETRPSFLRGRLHRSASLPTIHEESTSSSDDDVVRCAECSKRIHFFNKKASKTFYINHTIHGDSIHAKCAQQKALLQLSGAPGLPPAPPSCSICNVKLDIPPRVLEHYDPYYLRRRIDNM